MTEAKTSKPVKGVIVLLIRPDGHVVGVGTDFEGAGYGGFDLREAQEFRARRAMALDLVERIGGPDIASVMSSYESENIVRELQDRKGWRRFVHAIGHEEQES